MGCCGDQIRNKEDREEAGSRHPNGKDRTLAGTAQATGEVERRTVTARKRKKTSAKERGIHTILGNKAVRIRWCPKKMVELKVMHLDESVQKEELTARVAEAAEYSIMDVRITSTHSGVGDEHRLSEVPLEAEMKTAGKGRIFVGRSSAKIQLTQAKPLRCYGCLQEGHVGAKCPTGPTEIKYFRGSGTGHTAANCGRYPHYEERTGGGSQGLKRNLRREKSQRKPP
ncbi:UNVERIFIED_CONTAM: hypothetical protein PYX00_002600 [Menopon gallinae]|uniref:CCHC-type domain-containing protein n=1 Tax=Menopon gallinae TaxID=328185 RepID=A0AAW2IHI5_9NEOP